jgi:hypothetical protein
VQENFIAVQILLSVKEIVTREKLADLVYLVVGI